MVIPYVYTHIVCTIRVWYKYAYGTEHMHCLWMNFAKFPYFIVIVRKRSLVPFVSLVWGSPQLIAILQISYVCVCVLVSVCGAACVHASVLLHANLEDCTWLATVN